MLNFCENALTRLIAHSKNYQKILTNVLFVTIGINPFLYLKSQDTRLAAAKAMIFHLQNG